MTSDDRMPAEAFPPGDYLAEELEARGWTLEDFAGSLRWSKDATRRLIKGEVPLGAVEAQALGRVLGTSPEFWLNLESTYRRWLSRPRGSGHWGGAYH